MPVFKDKKSTWFVKCYYKTWDGQTKEKRKRGFAKKKDALEWERNFLETQQRQPDM